jgi:hypothetical protein
VEEMIARKSISGLVLIQSKEMAIFDDAEPVPNQQFSLYAGDPNAHKWNPFVNVILHRDLALDYSTLISQSTKFRVWRQIIQLLR